MKTPALITLASLAVLPFVRTASAQSLAMGPDSPPRLDVLAEGVGPSSGSNDRSEASDPSLAPADTGKQWHATFAPYAWLTSLSGNVTVRNIKVDADVSFTDLIDKSDTLVGLMGVIDVEYDRFIFGFNGAYASVKFDGARGVFQNGTVSADVTMDLGWFELLGGYRILEKSLDDAAASKRRLVLDAFVGGRLTTISVDASLSASATVTLPDGEVLNVGATRDRSNSKDWFEPFVGARLGIDLSDRWTMFVRGDVGGFGIDGAKFAWQTMAAAGYHWEMDGWRLSAFGGFRALGQNYSSGGFGWDEIVYGPIIGAAFTFAF